MYGTGVFAEVSNSWLTSPQNAFNFFQQNERFFSRLKTQ